MRFFRKSSSNLPIIGIILLTLGIFFIIGSFTFFKKIPMVNAGIHVSNSPFLSFNKNFITSGEKLIVSVNNSNYKEDDLTFTWSVGDNNIENTSNTYTPTDEDIEKFIKVSVEIDDKTITASLYFSKLPVIYINTDADYITEEYSESEFSMQTSSMYQEDNTSYFGKSYIKLRGNSTLKRDKQPFKIKLEEEANLFNLGKNKHWVLLANDIDHTFIRNKLLFDFSASLGSSYASESLNVILILNNKYNGVYQLAEQVRIDENRVDIFNYENLAKEAASIIASIKKNNEGLDKKTTSLIKKDIENMLTTDFSWLSKPYEFEYNNTIYKISDLVDIPSLTGGFLLEMDFYSMFSNSKNSLITNFSQPFYFSSPEYLYTNTELKDYAKNYIQTFEYALHSPDFTYKNSDTHYIGNEVFYDSQKGWIKETTKTNYFDKTNDNKHYTELFSLSSLVNNFLVTEFSMNWDSMKNSVFVTKDIDELAELGPVWDYDWAFGNKNMYSIDTYFPESWHTTNDYFTNEYYYQSVQWNRYLIKDPYFLLQVYNKYKEIRPTIIEEMLKDGGKIDTYEKLYKEAGLANDKLWSYSYKSYDGSLFSKAYVELNDFIDTRTSWLDTQFSSFETLLSSLNYYKPSDSLNISEITESGDYVILSANTTNSDAKKISFQINGKTIINENITNGSSQIKINKDLLLESGKNIVVIRLIDTSDDYINDQSSLQLFGDDVDSISPLSNYKVF